MTLGRDDRDHAERLLGVAAGSPQQQAGAAARSRVKPLRVLALVTDAHGGFGGISQYNRDVLEVMSAGDEFGQIDVLPRHMKQPAGVLPPKVTYDTAGVGSVGRFAVNTLRHAWSMGRADLVYCAHVNLMPVAIAAAAMLRAPIALAVYGVDVWHPVGPLPPALLKAQIGGVVSISEITRDRFQAWCPIATTAMHLVPNGLRMEAYGEKPRNAELQRRLGLEGRTVVMTLGRMAMDERSKGFDRMIELLPRLAEQIPNVVYVMVGGGTERPHLEAMVAERKLQDRVRFAGLVSDEQKPDHYRLADVFVMPSTGDGFGFVVVEALACGVPVVVSSVDGTREAVRGGALGLIADPHDPDEIIRNIHLALKRPRGVPAGLEYFAFERFSERLRAALANIVAK